MQGFLPFRPDLEPECSLPASAVQDGVSVWVHTATSHLLSAEEIASNYLLHGIKSLAAINAGVLVLIHDRKRNECHLGIDRMGIETVSYARNGDGIAFSTRAGEVAARLSDDPVRVSRQQFYDFLFFHAVPAPGSIYEGVSKLLPAEVLTVSAGGERRETYWAPAFADTLRDDARSHQQLLDTLHNAVDRATLPGATGAFLSGGLDSSSVSGALARHQSPARTFSIGFDVEGYDELPFARAANRHFGCDGHEYVAHSDDVVRVFDDIAGAYDEPFGNSSVVPTLLCARLAKDHGISLLLAGDGGDELFAGNEHYARQVVFEAYSRIPSVLRRLIFDPLARAVPPMGTPLRKFKSYVEQANIKLPRRFEAWNYAYRESVSKILDPEFGRHIDLESPFRLMEEVYETTRSGDIVDDMLAYDWKFTLADSDLRKVTRMCELADIKVAFPMLDNELVDFSMQMAGREKMRRLKLRSFYKNAVADFLPQEVLTKQKHGFGMPFGVWLKQDPALAEMIYAHLRSLKDRGIFQEGFIEQLIQDQQQGHASYFGYFVWDLAILDAWLGKLGPSTWA